MIVVRADNRIRLPIAAVSDECADELREEFTHDNPIRSMLFATGHAREAKRTAGVIETWRREGDDLTFPRGSLHAVRSILADHGHATRVLDRRLLGQRVSDLRYDVELWPFQEQMVQAGIRDRGGLWRAPPGSGKSVASLAFAARVGLRSLVVVPTDAIFEQWLEHCREEISVLDGMSDGLEPGQIRGGKWSIGDVTIAMQKSLVGRVDEVAGEFGVVVADEVQLFAAETFDAVIDALPAAYRLGVSASERRADRLDFKIREQFGTVSYQVDQVELERQRFILPVEVRVVTSELSVPWWEKMGDKARKRDRKRRNKLVETIAQDAERNALVNELALWCARGEKAPTVVLSHRRQHCAVLERLYSIADSSTRRGMLVGARSAEGRRDFQAARRGMNAGEVGVCFGTYQAVGVGFDAKRLSRAVCATPCANSTSADLQWNQFRGRIARSAQGKPAPVIYYVWDRKLFGDKPVRNLIKWNGAQRVKIAVGGRFVPARDVLDGKDTTSSEEIYGKLFE